MLGIIFDEEEKSGAVAGDNVKLKLRGIEEEVCTVIQNISHHHRDKKKHGILSSSVRVQNYL